MLGHIGRARDDTHGKRRVGQKRVKQGPREVLPWLLQRNKNSLSDLVCPEPGCRSFGDCQPQNRETRLDLDECRPTLKDSSSDPYSSLSIFPFPLQSLPLASEYEAGFQHTIRPIGCKTASSGLGNWQNVGAYPSALARMSSG